MKIIVKSIISFVLTVLLSGCTGFSPVVVTRPLEATEIEVSTVETGITGTQRAISTDILTITPSLLLPSPSPETPPPLLISSNDIAGVWTGEAQWFCGHNDPPWTTTVEFQPNGNFTATMTLHDLSESSVASGNWSISESNIEIRFTTTMWRGTVSNKTMGGGITDSDFSSCDGAWSLVKS